MVSTCRSKAGARFVFLWPLRVHEILEAMVETKMMSAAELRGTCAGESIAFTTVSADNTMKQLVQCFSESVS